MQFKVFNQNTLLILMIFTSGCIECMHPSITSVIKNILCDNSSDHEQKFTEQLRQHPEFLATVNQNAAIFAKGQTLAHWVINNMNLELLNIMYEHGETALTRIQHSPHTRAPHERAVGSTPYLTLCFNIRRIRPEQAEKVNLYLSLLQKFGERTPALAITPRNDGMTPAMAFASSNSDLKLQCLQLLLSIHPQALMGRTIPHKNTQSNSIANLLLDTPDTESSIESLRLVLHAQKDDPSFPQTLTELRYLCSRYRRYPQTNYMNIIEAYIHNCSLKMNDVPSRLIAQPALTRPPLNGFDKEGNCYCCMLKCFCCQSPNNPRHAAFWAEYHRNNPK